MKKRIFFLSFLVLLLLLTGCSGPKHTAEELRPVLDDLLPRAAEINEIYFGDGLPTNRDENAVRAFYETFDTDIAAISYTPVDPACGYETVDDIRRATLEVFTDTYAETLRMIKGLLPKDGVINFVEVPLASQANRWRDQQNVYSGWGSSLELMLYQSLGGAQGINVYSAWDLLAPYVCGETPMFYFTDHHWSAEAAYIVSSAMLEDQGLPVIPYSEYKYKAITSSAVDDSGRRDVFNCLYPLTPVHSYVVKNGQEHEISLMAYDVPTYTCFMNGSREPWRRIVTGAGSARKALVICDSFGNAFTPYLLPYYGEVHMCDFRNGYYDHNAAGGYIKDNIARYGIDDVYIIISTANDLRKDNSIKYLRRYLGF